MIAMMYIVGVIGLLVLVVVAELETESNVQIGLNYLNNNNHYMYGKFHSNYSIFDNLYKYHNYENLHNFHYDYFHIQHKFDRNHNLHNFHSSRGSQCMHYNVQYKLSTQYSLHSFQYSHYCNHQYSYQHS